MREEEQEHSPPEGELPNNGHRFRIKDCALAALSTGKSAQNLRELREILTTITPDSIYYHFWGALLRPRFDDPLYHNDFAIWSRYGLKDSVLAERLSIIDPADYPDLEDLRAELIEIIEERLDQVEVAPWARTNRQFFFIRSQLVAFDTHHLIHEPRDLADVVPKMSVGSIFLHVIDARRRTENRVDDFQAWIRDCYPEYEDLCRELSVLDPFFSGLSQIRSQLSAIFQSYFRR